MTKIKVRELAQSGIGNFISENLALAKHKDSVLSVLNRIKETGDSCVPFVNDKNLYEDSYSTSDIRVNKL